jgi:hypothetical protein
MPMNFQPDFEHLTSDIEKSRFLTAFEMTGNGVRNDREGRSE